MRDDDFKGAVVLLLGLIVIFISIIVVITLDGRSKLDSIERYLCVERHGEINC